jgi:CubicO group peptidase (beta-lactamase class C family)
VRVERAGAGAAEQWANDVRVLQWLQDNAEDLNGRVAALRRESISETVLGLGLEDPTAVVNGVLALLSRLPLEFSPGDAWNYSISTDVLGVLIERITGNPFQEELKSRIFDPLQMHETSFVVREDQAERFAACYLPTPQGGMNLLDDPKKSAFLKSPTFYSGGGGLVSTADDYMKFCRMLLAGGQANGHRLISPSTLRLMTANHLPGGKDLTALSRSLFSESTNAGVGFGLGFAVVFDPVRAMVPSSPGEYYWGGAASTAFWIDPVEDIAVVFMTQLLGSSTYPVRRELRTLVYSALVQPNRTRY